MSGVNRVPEQSVFKGFLSIFKDANRVSSSSKLLFIASGFFLATASFFYLRNWGKQTSNPSLQDKDLTHIVKNNDSTQETFDSDPEEIERSETPEEAFGNTTYQGHVSPISPTHSTQSNESFSKKGTDLVPRTGTPDSAYGKHAHQGHVTTTSMDFPKS